MKRVARVAAVLGTLAALAFAVTLPAGLDWPARASLLGFGGAAVCWILTDLSASFIAVVAALSLVAVGAIDQDTLFAGLGAKVVWLIIGTFVLGAAVEKSGLAARLTALIVGRGTTVGSLLWRLTLGVVLLSFLIPSTSGRATVLRPVYRTLVEADPGEQLARAVGLLIPAVIVVSTICSLTGAGSHLVAVDLLEEQSGQTIGFGRWMLWGLPFGLVACLATTLLVGRLFLDRESRARRVAEPDARSEPLTGAEWRTAAVVVAMLGLWLTEGYHPFGIAIVAIAGAVVLTMPGLGVLRWKEGLEAVNWALVLFVAAALVLARALISTGAAGWLIEHTLALSGLTDSSPVVVILLSLLALTMSAHLYIVSHTARVAALLPPLLLMAKALHLNPVAVALLANVGIDYCLTLPVSSKALLIFQQTRVPGSEEFTWGAADLLKLSAAMAPVYLMLAIGFYWAYWRHVGLAL